VVASIETASWRRTVLQVAYLVLMNRLFGFQTGEMVVRRFKERGAEYYRGTRQAILNEMVKGNVIHADETRIRLHGKTGYVWVFTTLRSRLFLF
jgi:hypothetical protein